MLQFRPSKSLKVTEYEVRCIERNTREQCHSSLWHSVRRYKITASSFGAVLSHKESTPPDKLVLRILQPKNFTSPATSYGIAMEPVAVKAYVTYQESHAHANIPVTQCGFHISRTAPFLGASPDGAVYDPSTVAQPFGFLEVKCPFTARDLTLADACALPGFCCALDPTNGQLKLKRNHPYFILDKFKDKWQLEDVHGVTLWYTLDKALMSSVSLMMKSFGTEFYCPSLLPFMMTVLHLR